MPSRPRPAIDRFWEKVSPEPNSGCWLWTAALFQNTGYALFNPSTKRPVAGHRFAYEYYRGNVPEGLELDHLCRVRCCVNPDHLEAVTHGENVRRSPIHKERIKTHCSKGHAYDLDNTYVIAGKRKCRRCNADYMNRYRQRHARDQNI